MTDLGPGMSDPEVFSPELALVDPELRQSSLERLALAEASALEAHAREPAEPTPNDELSGDELREKTLTGVRWLGTLRAVSIPLAFGSQVILARLIDPAAFGRAAIALIVVNLATVVAVQGVCTGLVQFPRIEREETEMAMFLSLLLGVLLTAATLILGPTLLASIFGEETARLIELASPAWAIAAVGAVPVALVQRRVDFRRIAMIDFTSVWTGTLVSVGLAAAGLGSEALVAGGLAMIAVGTVLYSLAAGMVRPAYHPHAFTKLLGKGAPVSASSILFVAFDNADIAILGARLSPAEVGLYNRALQVGASYYGKISSILVQMSFPVYARTGSVERMLSVRTRITQVHAAVIAPLLVYFVVVADVLVPWLFGEKWAGSVEPARILTVVGLTSAVVTGNGPLLIAVGRTGTLFVWTACEMVAYCAVLFLIAPLGLTWVAIGLAAFNVLKLAALQYVLHRFVGVPFRQIWIDILPGVSASVVAGGVAYPLLQALTSVGAPVVVTLTVVGLVMGALYLVLLRLAWPRAAADLRLIAERFVPARHLSRLRGWRLQADA
jgi:PST family polysaccharide transporter